MRVTVAALDKQGNSVVNRVLDVLRAFDVGQSTHYGLISPKKCLFQKNLNLIGKQSVESSTVIGYAASQPATASSYEFLQLEDAALLFEGKIYEPIPKPAIAHQAAKEPRHCEATLQTLIQQADGDYQFLLIKDGWMATARDPIGVQPLYFGENKEVAAVATNKKALWKLGIENPTSFPPGNLAFTNRDGFQFKPVKKLTYTEPAQVGIGDAAKTLQALLEESIRRRVHGLKKVAVAFSGGLDSSVVAFLANKLGIKVSLLHVSLENQEETEEAIEAAEALDLPLHIHLFKDSDVEATLPKVVELIEEPDPIKASIGVPFYWAAEKAADAGFKVLLAGQGADELFGGYQRYVNLYCQDGSEKTLKTIFDDVVNIHTSNLERDLKITGFHDVELRLPFASFDLAKFALSLPIECKIEQNPETLRKLVLRKMALNVGVPAAVAKKPKKAVQYSTGINNAIKRLAKKQQKSVNEYINELYQHLKEDA
ncbi:MAG: asparagine synthetase B [Candidatus Bathyarchaeota archaeon]|nr:asparagine synthetase B [Candidatus Bathyarchaeota archaeon]